MNRFTRNLPKGGPLDGCLRFLRGTLAIGIVAATQACGSPEPPSETIGRTEQQQIWGDPTDDTGQDLPENQFSKEQDDPGTRDDVLREDNRFDVFIEPDPWLRSYAERGTAILIPTSQVKQPDPTSNRRDIISRDASGNPIPLKKQRTPPLCDGEVFADEPSAGINCSATLIADDLVLTAGHCIAEPFGSPNVLSPCEDCCGDMSLVFNYYHRNFSSPQTITADDVFKCKDVVLRFGNPSVAVPEEGLLGVRQEPNKADYAVLRLERAATPRFEPVPTANRFDTALIANADPVAMLGFPEGQPTKIDAQARVVENEFVDGALFSTTEAFGGNSGAGIYGLNKFGAYRLIGVHSFSARDGYTPPTPCTVDGTPNAFAQRWVFCDANNVNPLSNLICSASKSTHSFLPLEALCEHEPDLKLCASQLSDPIPPHDRCDNAIRIEATPGQQVTLTGSTRNADDDYEPTCTPSGFTSGPDVYYSFAVTQRSAVYVDGFNSDFDAMLAIVKECDVIGRQASDEVDCKDDSECASNPDIFASNFRAPQIARVLEPDNYLLAVDGFNGEIGQYIVHFQILPISSDFNPMLQNLLVGDTEDGVGGVVASCGKSGGADDSWYVVSCPDYPGNPFFFAQTVGLATFDTVLDFRQGNVQDPFCNDDIAPFLQSRLEGSASRGSGISILYIDGWGPGQFGSYSISHNIPTH